MLIIGCKRDRTTQGTLAKLIRTFLFKIYTGRKCDLKNFLKKPRLKL